MTERSATVVVGADEGLSDVIDRLRGAASGGSEVNLVVPIDSSLLLTAREFRTLKDAIDEHRLAVRVRTSDPLRLQLAERLGVEAKPMPRPRPVAVPAAPALPHGEAPQDRAEAIAEAPPFVGPTPRPDPNALWPSPNGDSPEDGEVEAPAPGDGPARERLLERPPRRWLPVALGLVLIVAAALFALRFAVPRAVIHVIPKTAPVAGSLVFDVTPDGKPLDGEAAFALVPMAREFEVTWDGDAPVTGKRVVPDGIAGGPIELRNPAPEPVTVDAGTVVRTEGGVEFAFTEAVTVPAADAATGKPGAATGSVQARQAGSAGNAGTGEVGGRLPNGVYYSNRMQPATGGTDKTFPIVAQVDLDALNAQAAAAAADLVNAALAKNGQGAAVVPSSVTITDQQDAFDHQVDDEVDRVGLHATMTIQAMVYQLNAAEARYKPALAGQLSGAAPEGYAVAPDAVVYQTPTAIDESAQGVRLEVAANADAAAVLSEAERTSLAQALAGKSPAEAAAILAKSPRIASFTVDYEPAWLAKQMPSNAGRIEFEVGS